jgi:Pleckstrin homology domain
LNLVSSSPPTIAPQALSNLDSQADASEVTKDSSNDFSFKINGHKHVFQATSHAERDSWITAIEAKTAEGKGLKEGVVGSEGFKKHIEKYRMFAQLLHLSMISLYLAEDF